MSYRQGIKILIGMFMPSADKFFRVFSRSGFIFLFC